MNYVRIWAKKRQNLFMDNLYITHYFYPGTDPWKNIMLLPEKEAFRKAEELAIRKICLCN